MGTFRQRIELAASVEGPFRVMYALVDTGSAFTWVPGRILRELGVAPFDQYKFVRANGDEIRRDRAEAVIRLDGRVLHTICVFGEEKDQTLLGAYTLEGFALSVDPLGKRLVPMPTIPAASTDDATQRGLGMPAGMKRDQSVASVTAAEVHDSRVAEHYAQLERIRGAEPDFWGTVATRFRSDPRRELDPVLAKVASFLLPDDVLVDVGGGAGRNCLPLALHCREVINVDPSRGMGAEFGASAKEAAITNARFVEGDWLEVERVEGDVVLAAHVTYFVPKIVPFVRKLESAARRRVILDVLTVPPPNQMAAGFRIVYGEERAPVPDSDELLAVLDEMGIAPEVIDLGSSTIRRPLPQTREEAISSELGVGWLRAEDNDLGRRLLEEHFSEIFVETPQGFARRHAMGALELLITWETTEPNAQR